MFISDFLCDRLVTDLNFIRSGHVYVYMEQGCAENRNSVWNQVFKNRTVHKFDIRSDGFPTETACNLPFK